jgi:hypothetical protein
MLKYWYIPFSLLDTLRQIFAEFRANGGFVIVTSIEPPREPETPFLGIGTGIYAQSGEELLASINSHGFCVEGDLHTYGYAEIAQNLGCVPYDTSNEFLNFVTSLDNQ